MKKAILVIDPFISSEYLCSRLNEEGYKMIVLKTIKNIPAYFSLKIPATTIESSGDVQEDIALLRKLQYDIVSGIYGVETSVEYADKIFACLFPNNCNNPNTSKLRYVKYQMLEAMHDTPYYVNQVALNNQAYNPQNIKKVSNFLARYPECIIKPSYGSAGTFGIQAINNLQEYQDYCHKENFLLAESNQFVFQEKINIKKEFYVDVASCKNKHLVTAIGCYSKDNLKYNYLEHLDNTRHENKLTEIVLEVLKQLGVSNGLSHIEIAYTQDNHYKLIEYNPRISGAHGYANKMAKNSSNVDQIDAYLGLLNDVEVKKLNKNIHQRLIILHQVFNHFTELLSHHLYTPLISPDNPKGDTLTSAKGLLMLYSDKIEDIRSDTYKILGKY
jgi:biotin carboxylase